MIDPRSLMVPDPAAILVAHDQAGRRIGGWPNADEEGFVDAIHAELEARGQSVQDYVISTPRHLAMRLAQSGAEHRQLTKQAKRLERRLKLAPGGCPMRARGTRALLEATGLSAAELEAELDLPALSVASMLEGRGLSAPELVEKWNRSGRHRLIYRLEVGRPEGWLIQVIRA